jgi:hypothetical protein
MDPITILLVCFVAAKVIQYAAEDIWAGARGRPSPRLERRELRQQLAQRQATTTGTPGVLQAVGDRLGSRIANPPDRRFARTLRGYLDEVLADGVEAARQRHADKVAAKQAVDQPPQPGPAQRTVQDAVDDTDILEAEVIEDYRPNPVADPDPRPAASDDVDTPAYGIPTVTPDTPESTVVDERADWGHCKTAGCDRDADCPEGLCYSCDHGYRPCAQCHERARGVDAEQLCRWCVADNAVGGPPFTCAQCETAPVRRASFICRDCVSDASRKPGDPPPESPEPAPTPDSTTEGTSPVSQTHINGAPAGDIDGYARVGSTTRGTPVTDPLTIDGDGNDPTGALRFSLATDQFCLSVSGQYETLANCAEQGGAGPNIHGEIRNLSAAFAAAAADGAALADIFKTHVTKQNALGHNPDLHDAIRGYLDSRHATA